MSLEQTKAELGWPSAESILRPTGAAAAVNAALAQEKIGRSLHILEDAADARVGVLSSDPGADETQAPLALVCEFPRPVPAKTLAELHRLAWNFSRTPLLLTVEPHQMRAFTCCERPQRQINADILDSEIPEARYDFKQPVSLADRATHALHWLELASGRFVHKHERRFSSDDRADSLLLDNLKIVREQLLDEGLERDIARIAINRFRRRHAIK